MENQCSVSAAVAGGQWLVASWGHQFQVGRISQEWGYRYDFSSSRARARAAHNADNPAGGSPVMVNAAYWSLDISYDRGAVKQNSPGALACALALGEVTSSDAP